jgi:hypothetical protein
VWIGYNVWPLTHSRRRREAGRFIPTLPAAEIACISPGVKNLSGYTATPDQMNAIAVAGSDRGLAGPVYRRNGIIGD